MQQKIIHKKIDNIPEIFLLLIEILYYKAA